jgi:chromate transporter
MSRHEDVIELARLFLRLGTTAFGGPAAHIAMMEDEVVRRRKWLSHGEFLDLIGATNLIPGPNSTELAIHVGHRRAGVPGLIVAGVSFVLPAAAIVTVIAWVYVRFGTLPQSTGLLYGVKPVIVAVIVQALWRLSATAVKTRLLAALGAAALALSVLGVNELALMLGAGLLMAAIRAITTDRNQRVGAVAPMLGAASSGTLLSSAAASGTSVGGAFGLMPLFLFFVKVGSVLFGSGYVLLVFLRADLVERWHWLNEGQLLDAIAVGQVTPGPVFTTATFIGYVLGGIPGAGVATVGIFLPAFVFVALSGPLVPRIRRSAIASAFLDGVIVASLALMAVVSWHLGRTALIDGPTFALALFAAVLLFSTKVNSAWLVAGAALIGLLLGRP